MIRELHRMVVEREELVELDPAELRLALRSIVAPLVDEAMVGETVLAIEDEIAGYGVLGPLTRLPGVTDILVNGPDEVWIERDGRLELAGVRFDSKEHLEATVERLSDRARMRVDASFPMADGSLPDGVRLNVTLPPVAPCGPLVALRLWPGDPLTIDDLVSRGALDIATKERLIRAVSARWNILISGATGAGKTTLLNALLSCVDPGERIVTIEESAELNPVGRHAVSLLARVPNIEGRGRIDQAALLRNSLRLRPDRIVVGEARGEEAWVALCAMATGHLGSLLTVHAGSATGALARLKALAAEAPGSSPAAIDSHLSAIDLVVQMERSDGRRRVVELLEP